MVQALPLAQGHRLVTEHCRSWNLPSLFCKMGSICNQPSEWHRARAGQMSVKGLRRRASLVCGQLPRWPCLALCLCFLAHHRPSSRYVSKCSRKEGGREDGAQVAHAPSCSQLAAQGLAPGPAVESLIPKQPGPVLEGAKPRRRPCLQLGLIQPRNLRGVVGATPRA